MKYSLDFSSALRALKSRLIKKWTFIGNVHHRDAMKEAGEDDEYVPGREWIE